MEDQVPVYLTPHKLSLLILVKHYFEDAPKEMDAEALQNLGLFLMQEISVRTSHS
jgi:hypothetical protein